MISRSKWFLVVAALSAFALVAAACNDDVEAPVDEEVELTPVAVQFSFLPGGRESWFNLADERGYFEDEGLDVEVTPGEGGVASLRNVDIGEFDFAVGPISRQG